MQRKIDDDYLYYKEMQTKQRLRERAYDNDYPDDDVTDLTEIFKEYID